MPAPPPPLGRLNAEPATQLRQRPTKDGSRLNYPCPLFEYSPYSDGIMGLSLNSIQWDVLHVIDLGVTQRLAGTVLQGIIWHPEDLLATGHDAAEERLAHGVQALSVRLTEFYNLRKDLSDKPLSELRKITPAMVGPREAPNLHAKGAETRHLLPWLQQLLLEFGPRLGDEGMRLTLLPQILPLSVLPASLACPPPPAYRRLAPISGTFVVSSWPHMHMPLSLPFTYIFLPTPLDLFLRGSSCPMLCFSCNLDVFLGNSRMHFFLSAPCSRDRACFMRRKHGSGCV